MTLDQLSAAEKDAADLTGVQWPFFGYAPGFYMGTCQDCKAIMVGCAKRSTSCFACAIKAAIDQLRTGQLVAVADDAIERYRHVKRGTVYEVVGEAELQMNADNLVDGSQMMVYRGEDGRLWCRHYDEFHDGRFAAMKDTQP